MIKRTYEIENFVFHSEDGDGEFRVEVCDGPAVYVTRDELMEIRDLIAELLAISPQ